MSWYSRPLHELCDGIVVGHVGPSSAHRDPRGVPFLMGKNVGPGYLKLSDLERISPGFHAAQRKSQLRPNDVVVVRIGASGQAAKVPPDLGEANCAGLVVVKEPRGVLPDFLVRFLNSPAGRRQSLQHVKGSTRSTLNTTSVADALIPVPPLDEQRRIADILDRADAVRAKRRAALALLDELIQSIFLDMFGDPATNPKGWPMRTISDLVLSATYGTSQKAADTGGMPILRMGNLSAAGEMLLDDLKYIDLPESQRERYSVRRGDVLFNRTNSADLVGKTAIYRGAEPMAYAGYLIRIRTTPTNHPEYLAAFLNTPHAKRVLRGMCKQAIGMANINATELQRVAIPQPPHELQQEFARRLSGARAHRTLHVSSLAAMDALFASLQDRAFRGEL